MTTMASVFNRKKVPTRSAYLLLDQSLVEQKLALERQLDAAERLATRDGALHAPEVARLSDQLADLDAVIESNRQEFTFRGLPADEWRALKDDCPLDPELRAEYLKNHVAFDDFDIDTLAPRLIAAASVDPPISDKDAARMWAEWTEGEVARLFKAAYLVQENTRDVSFGLPGSESTRNSGQNSDTPADTGSLIASSSAES